MPKFTELAWVMKADEMAIGFIDEADAFHGLLSVKMNLLEMLEGLPNKVIDAAAFDNNGKGDGTVVLLKNLDGAGNDQEMARRLLEVMQDYLVISIPLKVAQPEKAKDWDNE